VEGAGRSEATHGWEALRLGALATSLIDGLSVWLRETRRPETERSSGILRHETDRASITVVIFS
jgi:hypothetical protein